MIASKPGVSAAFKEWLTQAMAGRGMSARELARALHVAPATATEWRYRGRVPVPENCRALARYFGVPESEVLRVAGWE